ncbi:hypothetical protein ACFQHV_00980 [Promicromonospora thailandica]|uniref:Uncharacterized protein n=1 Tax=Promicromonospora thailandica TaxID=765201 RepID=A0A9X2G598_9MICO|nr:hypothetical protein [Promicromonospora thailandica]MCP2265572.1 hypothetical protein [Promicromonospora thailandica]BFF17135.1 hypothetical protein GCM10025730_06560 [Promicromonospora thailandica]
MQKNDDARPELEVGDDGLVPIYHHKSDLETRVLPKAVRGWLRQGWSTEKAAAAPAADGGSTADRAETAEVSTATETPASVPVPGRTKSEAAPAAKSK